MLSLLCLLGFSSAFPSLDVAAYDLPAGTTHISSDTLVSWLGTTLPAQYVGTDLEYHSTTARRISSTESIVSSDMDGYTSNLYNGRTMAWYLVDIPTADTFTVFPYAPIVTIDFNLHFQNVTYCDFGFADYVSNKYQNVSYTTVQPYCYLDYNYQGQYNKLFNPVASGTYAGHLGTFGTALSASYNTHYGGGIIQLSGSSSDLYIGTVSACCLGNFNDGLIVGICLLDIIINNDYILSTSAPPPQGGESGGGDTPSGPSSGSVTGTIKDNGDGTQDVNITIEQDNSGLIGGILDGFKNLFQTLFVPDEDFMNEWQGDLRDDFNEHLGAAAEVVSLMDEHADYLRNAVATNTIYFPGVSFPDAGGTVHQLIASQDVELQPFKEGRMRPLYTAAALAVDLVCLFAVFNMLQDKYEIFLNPDAEVISYDN